MKAPSLGCTTLGLEMVKDEPEVLKYIGALTFPSIRSSF